MTHSPNEQPAVDTSALADRLNTYVRNRRRRYTGSGGSVLVDDQPAADMEAAATALRSVAAHPDEPEGMELETTAEERSGWFLGRADDAGRLARDLARALRVNTSLEVRLSMSQVEIAARDDWRARAEKAEALAVALRRDLNDTSHHRDAAEAEAKEAKATLATYQQPVGDAELASATDDLNGLVYAASDGFLDNSAYEKPAQRIGSLIRHLSTQLRDEQARSKGMEAVVTNDAVRFGLLAGRFRGCACHVKSGAHKLSIEEAEIFALEARNALSRPEGSAS